MSRRRTQRYFLESDRAALLQAIGTCRDACIKAESAAPIGGDIYNRTSSLIESIDAVAEVLTGDKTHFHTKTAAAPSQVSQQSE